MLFQYPTILQSRKGFYYQQYREKSGNVGHQVNSDINLQKLLTVEIQMRRLLMSRLIRIYTVCLVNLFFIPIFNYETNKVAVQIYLMTEVT